jgi:hypothetical protein
MIVPLPVNVPLLGITSPLAKRCVPPDSWSVAALTPLPTLKTRPLS